MSFIEILLILLMMVLTIVFSLGAIAEKEKGTKTQFLIFSVINLVLIVHLITK